MHQHTYINKKETNNNNNNNNNKNKIKQQYNSNSLHLRSSELKSILCIILFQLFDLIFIELEPNI